jgi:hypothetical protein
VVLNLLLPQESEVEVKEEIAEVNPEDVELQKEKE